MVQRPEEVFGYPMGAAGRLPDWGEIVGYFDGLAAASDRVSVERLGLSTGGLPYIAVTVTSPTNLARRDALRSILARLAEPRGLDHLEEADLIELGRPTAFLLCSQHSTEIGATLMTLELAADFAAATDHDHLEILENVVTVIIPNHNPDGHQMVVEWYRRWHGTPYEGQGMPWLYHRYVGHDNNRDWFMLTQAETRLYVRLFNRERPQLVFDMHQMGRDGARFMVPPFIDPLDPNQDPVIQQGFADLGTAIAARLTAAGKRGVATNIIFDNYSPSLAYGNYHGSVDLLSEAASCRLATPVTVEEEKLKVRDGFDPRVRSWNHPLPWQGGEWTLREIVEYDKLAALAFLEHAARNRRQWLRNYAGIARRMLERTEPPYAFLIPEAQDDPITAHELLETLELGAVKIERATEPFTADGVPYPAGTRVIRVAQPAGAFAKTLLEVQVYPDLRRWPEGPPRPPYDIAGHTLPLQMGVHCVQVAKPFEAALEPDPLARPVGDVVGDGAHGFALSPRLNRSIQALTLLWERGLDVARATEPLPALGLPSGALVIPAQPGLADAASAIALCTGCTFLSLPADSIPRLARQSPPRIAVYQSWKPAIDEGWVRWIFEEYGLAYTTVHDADVRAGNLRARFDTLVLPQQAPEDILNGNPEKNEYKEPYPPEYVGGLGQIGVDALRAFVHAGGTLVALDSSCRFAIRHFYLPVRDVVDGLPETEFYCPGSLLRILVDGAHPLGYGLRREEVALFLKSPVFDIDPPFRHEVTVVARYPYYEPNLSGWILGAEKLAGKAAMVDVPLGAGRVVLIGFRPQFRAQARGTYRLLFNAVLRAGLDV